MNQPCSMHPVLWLLSGLDPFGASGLAVDLKFASGFAVHPCPVMTSLTVQNHDVFDADAFLPHPAFERQLELLVQSAPPSVIKVGMLGTIKVLKILIKTINSLANVPLVLDPITHTSSGYEVLDLKARQVMLHEFFPMVSLLTPNFYEAEIFSGIEIKKAADFQRAVDFFLAHGVQSVFLKGGHGPLLDSSPDEILGLYGDREKRFWVKSPRRPYSCRGTGCALSTLIAALLGHDKVSKMDLNKLLPNILVRSLELLDQAYRDSYDFGKISESGTIRPRILKTHSSLIETCVLKIHERDNDVKGIHAPPLKKEELGFYPIVSDYSWLSKLVDWGAKTLQLRIKRADGFFKSLTEDQFNQALERQIADSADYCRRYGVRLFINDYWQLAVKYRAFGIHLGQEDLNSLSISDLEELRSTKLRIGISTHSEFELARANSYRPSYIALGPIFATSCKSMAFGPHGLPKIKKWVEHSEHPIVAIGGMTTKNALEALKQGASGVAVIADILQDQNPRGKVKEWQRIFEEHINIRL